MTGTNTARAFTAIAAIRAANEARGESFSEIDAEDIIDLLSDLRHLCDHRNECFGDLDKTAHQLYLDELETGGAA